MSNLEKNTFKILQRTAKIFGWVHRGTHRSWSDRLGFISPMPSHFDDIRKDRADSCTFWFHLIDDENYIIGFDWLRDKPNIVKTVGGSLPISTPINLSYVTTYKQLSNYFRESRAKSKAKV